MRSFYILIPTLTVVNMGLAIPHQRIGLQHRRQVHAADFAAATPPALVQTPDVADASKAAQILNRRGLFGSDGVLKNFFSGHSSSSDTSTSSNPVSDDVDSQLSSLGANTNSVTTGSKGADVVLGQGSTGGTFGQNGVVLPVSPFSSPSLPVKAPNTGTIGLPVSPAAGNSGSTASTIESSLTGSANSGVDSLPAGSLPNAGSLPLNAGSTAAGSIPVSPASGGAVLPGSSLPVSGAGSLPLNAGGAVSGSPIPISPASGGVILPGNLDSNGYPLPVGSLPNTGAAGPSTSVIGSGSLPVNLDSNGNPLPVGSAPGTASLPFNAGSSVPINPVSGGVSTSVSPGSGAFPVNLDSNGNPLPVGSVPNTSSLPFNVGSSVPINPASGGVSLPGNLDANGNPLPIGSVPAAGSIPLSASTTTTGSFSPGSGSLPASLDSNGNPLPVSSIPNAGPLPLNAGSTTGSLPINPGAYTGSLPVNADSGANTLPQAIGSDLTTGSLPLGDGSSNAGSLPVSTGAFGPLPVSPGSLPNGSISSGSTSSTSVSSGSIPVPGSNGGVVLPGNAGNTIVSDVNGAGSTANSIPVFSGSTGVSPAPIAIPGSNVGVVPGNTVGTGASSNAGTGGSPNVIASFPGTSLPYTNGFNPSGNSGAIVAPIPIPSGNANSNILNDGYTPSLPVPVASNGGNPLDNFDFDLSKDPKSPLGAPTLTSTLDHQADSKAAGISLPVSPSDTIDKTSTIVTNKKPVPAVTDKSDMDVSVGNDHDGSTTDHGVGVHDSESSSDILSKFFGWFGGSKSPASSVLPSTGSGDGWSSVADDLPVDITAVTGDDTTSGALPVDIEDLGLDITSLPTDSDLPSVPVDLSGLPVDVSGITGEPSDSDSESTDATLPIGIVPVLDSDYSEDESDSDTKHWGSPLNLGKDLLDGETWVEDSEKDDQDSHEDWTNSVSKLLDRRSRFFASLN
ncbi:hypothetical protein CC1G_04511 [Coprinopsis cinerea okayama7|uniref:Uncharacterized protein n=1 Tax=Coprinopsis cinerea (strain Okayama-7 / 130 / ATCC MYA-4618 / FGSC 9003) TaxID=240176 RepID=A8N5D3_COPC7|nr:hypothetical protein CC1G_04511 [Coprinopsis cinerea okayama7\|eukprot:XP_001830078.2 hypothetical protein CC1G_04511 [Coprinopsis cinerea okayama7\